MREMRGERRDEEEMKDLRVRIESSRSSISRRGSSSCRASGLDPGISGHDPYSRVNWGSKS